MEKDLNKILSFLHEAEKLKTVLRHSWLSSGRRESAADHTWRMALMAALLHKYLKKLNQPDLLKTLKMILVHDLVEIYAGDLPAWKKFYTPRLKSLAKNKEARAINRLTRIFPGKSGREMKSLWQEYEASETKEAKFAKALDKLEVKLQHQEADFKYLNQTEIRFNVIAAREICEYDPFLKNMRQALAKNWLKIYKKHKVNPRLYL